MSNGTCSFEFLITPAIILTRILYLRRNSFAVPSDLPFRYRPANGWISAEVARESVWRAPRGRLPTAREKGSISNNRNFESAKSWSTLITIFNLLGQGSFHIFSIQCIPRGRHRMSSDVCSATSVRTSRGNLPEHQLPFDILRGTSTRLTMIFCNVSELKFPISCC